jgi:hypothetical protein
VEEKEYGCNRKNNGWKRKNTGAIGRIMGGRERIRVVCKKYLLKRNPTGVRKIDQELARNPQVLYRRKSAISLASRTE